MFTLLLDFLLFSLLVVAFSGFIADKFRIRAIRECSGIVVLSLALYFLFGLCETVKKEGILVIELPYFPPPVGACFEIDMLSIFMSFTYLMLGIFAIIYSIKYMEFDTGLTEYYTLFLAMITGMIGVTFAGDFFTFLIFWEMFCITSYVLVAFRKERWAPIEAGFKYLIMSAFGTVTLLFAMSLLYGMTGTLNFAYLSSIIRVKPLDPWLGFILIGLIIGFGIKSAIVPLHTWLPDTC